LKIDRITLNSACGGGTFFKKFLPHTPSSKTFTALFYFVGTFFQKGYHTLQKLSKHSFMCESFYFFVSNFNILPIAFCRGQNALPKSNISAKMCGLCPRCKSCFAVAIFDTKNKYYSKKAKVREIQNVNFFREVGQRKKK